jgi:hypothetical protein
MKLHALALGLASILAAGAANAADRSMSRTAVRKDGLWYRDLLYFPPPDIRYVRDRVVTIYTQERQESATLRAIAPRARSAGYENIAAVYEWMATDHDRGADFLRDWLRAYDFRIPADPGPGPGADAEPVASINMQIDMHVARFNDAIRQLQGEQSEAVHGMLKMQAATAARHLSALRMLERDVNFYGRKALSERLRALISQDVMLSTAQLDRIIEEEMAFFRAQYNSLINVTGPPPTPEFVQVIERVIDRQVVVDRVVEKIVEKPVEKIIYVDRPGPAPQPRPAPIRRRRPAK